MKYIKKYHAFSFLIIALVFLSSCSSNDDSDKSEDNEVIAEKLAITSFKMLSSSHTFSVIKAHTQPLDSLVVCLFPSAVDYSNISPIIEFEGASIEYRINNEAFHAYNVSLEESIDFSYPNTIDFKVANSDNSDSKVYRIIVDTERPIVFNNIEIEIPDSQVNVSYSGLGISTWTNVGNYPIRLALRTTEYVDVVTPEAGLNNAFSTTLTDQSDFAQPNQSGDVNVFAGATMVGAYSATALFNLYFNENLGYLVYDDIANEYVKNIGYQKAALKLKGQMIE